MASAPTPPRRPLIEYQLSAPASDYADSSTGDFHLHPGMREPDGSCNVFMVAALFEHNRQRELWKLAPQQYEDTLPFQQARIRERAHELRQTSERAAVERNRADLGFADPHPESRPDPWWVRWFLAAYHFVYWKKWLT